MGIRAARPGPMFFQPDRDEAVGPEPGPIRAELVQRGRAVRVQPEPFKFLLQDSVLILFLCKIFLIPFPEFWGLHLWTNAWFPLTGGGSFRL